MEEKIIRMIELQLKELEIEERLVKKQLFQLKQQLTMIQEDQKAARKALLDLKGAEIHAVSNL